MSANPGNSSPRRFYRDTERGRLFGVCAGIADYFDIRVCPVRVVFVIAALVWFPVVIFAYIVMAFLVPRKPRDLYTDAGEEKFWRSMRKSPSETFSDVRYRFRQLEHRMQRMERYVTSPRFNLDQEFRELERDARRES